MIYLIFILYVVLSTTWSNSSTYAQFKLLRLFTVVPGSIGGALIIAQSNVRFARFLRLIVTFGILLSTLVIFQYISGTLNGGFSIGEGAYLLPSRIMGIAGLIFIYWLSKTQNFYKRIVLIILTSIHILGIFLSSSRGALVALFAAIGLFVLLQMWYNRYHIQLPHEVRDLGLTGLIGGTGVAIAISAGVVDLTSFRIVRRTLRLFLPNQTETSLLARIEHYQFSFEQWLQSPLFGHGIGSYGVLRTGEDIILYPHNIILEILIELGLIGFGLMSSLVFIGIIRIYRYKQAASDSTYSFLIAFAFFWFVSALFSFDITGNRHFLMSVALLCVSSEILEVNGKTE